MPPAVIDIKVTQEIEGDGGDGNSFEMSSDVGRHGSKNSAAHV